MILRCKYYMMVMSFLVFWSVSNSFAQSPHEIMRQDLKEVLSQSHIEEPLIHRLLYYYDRCSTSSRWIVRHDSTLLSVYCTTNTTRAARNTAEIEVKKQMLHYIASLSENTHPQDTEKYCNAYLTCLSAQPYMTFPYYVRGEFKRNVPVVSLDWKTSGTMTFALTEMQHVVVNSPLPEMPLSDELCVMEFLDVYSR